MSERESVRSFRSWLRTPVGVLVIVLAVVAFLYSLLIEGAVLLGILVVVLLLAVPWSLSVIYRLVRALERIADAQQRLVTLREREAE